MTGKSFFVYIATNKWNSVLYTGVTNDLKRRMREHKGGRSKFTNKYNVSKLIHFERFSSNIESLRRESQIKGLSRIKKLRLVWEKNPKLEDLSFL